MLPSNTGRWRIRSKMCSANVEVNNAQRDNRNPRRLRSRSDNQVRRRSNLSDGSLCASTAPITAPHCSTSRRKVIATAGSPIRPRRFSKSVSPNSKGALGRCAVATGQAALHFALVNLADTGGNIVSVPAAIRHDAHPAVLCFAAARHHDPLCRERQGGRHRQVDRREHQGASFLKPSAIRLAMSATSRRWQKSRIVMACRWSSTIPSPPRSC